MFEHVTWHAKEFAFLFSRVAPLGSGQGWEGVEDIDKWHKKKKVSVSPSVVFDPLRAHGL